MWPGETRIRYTRWTWTREKCSGVMLPAVVEDYQRRVNAMYDRIGARAREVAGSPVSPQQVQTADGIE